MGSRLKETLKCPGQNQRYWTFADIFTVECPDCGNAVEFFKDDPFRECDCCSTAITNPKADSGCRKHCNQADACKRAGEA